MKRSTSLALAVAVALAVAGCSVPVGAPASQSPLASGDSQPATAGAPSPTSATYSHAPPVPAASEPTAAGFEYRVTYDWAVPSNQVTIPHAVQAPIAPAPEPPLPYLVAVYAAAHPEANPPYQRISFFFRGAFPGYNLQYVPLLTAEGSGATLTLEGNAILRVGFVSAQSHDTDGASTVKETPTNPIGFQNLKSYGFAGDFEGNVTYGLGIQVAPDSDQALRIRAGEVKEPDGSGGFNYVVHIDVEDG